MVCCFPRSGLQTGMGGGVMGRFLLFILGEEDTHSWQEEGDAESIFWKFVAVLLPQIDSRGRDELFREPEEDQTVQCHMVRLGIKRIVEGTHRGEIRAIQMRCTSCSKRNRQNDVRGRAPLTAWCCSVHSEVYACKHKACWRSTWQRLDK